MSLSKIPLAAAAALLSTVLLACATNESEYTFNELPSDVRFKLNRHVQDGVVERIERQKVGGSVLYQVEYEREGENYILKVDDFGRIVEKREA